MEENEKLVIYAEYAQDATPREVEAKHNISYATALRLHNEFKKARDEGTLENLINMDAAVLAQVKDSLIVPGELEKAKADTFKKIEDGTQGLNRLDLELQATAAAVNRKILALLSSANQPSELETLTHCLCRIRESFFNKGGVQVNIQNNVGGAYQEFLSDVPTS